MVHCAVTAVRHRNIVLSAAHPRPRPKLAYNADAGTDGSSASAYVDLISHVCGSDLLDHVCGGDPKNPEEAGGAPEGDEMDPSPPLPASIAQMPNDGDDTVSEKVMSTSSEMPDIDSQTFQSFTATADNASSLMSPQRPHIRPRPKPFTPQKPMMSSCSSSSMLSTGDDSRGDGSADGDDSATHTPTKPQNQAQDQGQGQGNATQILGRAVSALKEGISTPDAKAAVASAAQSVSATKDKVGSALKKGLEGFKEKLAHAHTHDMDNEGEQGRGQALASGTGEGGAVPVQGLQGVARSLNSLFSRSSSSNSLNVAPPTPAPVSASPSLPPLPPPSHSLPTPVPPAKPQRPSGHRGLPVGAQRDEPIAASSSSSSSQPSDAISVGAVGEDVEDMTLEEMGVEREDIERLFNRVSAALIANHHALLEGIQNALNFSTSSGGTAGHEGDIGGGNMKHWSEWKNCLLDDRSTILAAMCAAQTVSGVIAVLRASVEKCNAEITWRWSLFNSCLPRCMQGMIRKMKPMYLQKMLKFWKKQMLVQTCR